jgi:DNA invertase Pin-like site-specific DNA recombinase
MNAAIYARKSTSKFGQKDTIENQIKICKRRAEDLGLTIVDIKTDTGTGTDDNNRQEVKDLIKGAIDGNYDCVIMKGISRLYRDVEKGLGLVKKLDRSGIRVITVEEGFDSHEQKKSGSLDTSMLTIFLMFAENESKKLASRIKHTQIEKAHAGEWNQASSVPFGYSYNPTTKKLELDYSKGEIIKLIYNLYLDGLGMKGIAHYLNGDNNEKATYPSPRGKMWSQYTIGFMLKNQVYVGDIVYNKRSKNARPYKNPESLGKTDEDVYIGNDYNSKIDWIVTPNAHEAIIEREIFDKVQAIIETKGIRTGIRNNISLLAGLAKCGKCGTGMTFKRGNKDKHGRINTKNNYYCSAYIKYGKQYCTSHHIGAEDFEDLILSDLQNELDSKLNIKNSTSNLKSNKNSNTSSNEKNLKKTERDITQLSTKMNTLLEKNIEGSVSDEQYKMLNLKFSNELNLLISQLEILKVAQERVLKNESNQSHLLNVYEEVRNIKTHTKEKQRYLLLDLISKISFDDGIVEIEYSF